MTKQEQVKRAIEWHFEKVYAVGNVFCAIHVHDGRFNQSYSEFVGDLRKLIGETVELFIYDPSRRHVVFYGSKKNAEKVSKVMSKHYCMLDWDDCPLEPLYSAVDYFTDERDFQGWNYYLAPISRP